MLIRQVKKVASVNLICARRYIAQTVTRVFCPSSATPGFASGRNYPGDSGREMSYALLGKVSVARRSYK